MGLRVHRSVARREWCDELNSQCPHVATALPFIPDWQGDETLYSWCARYHFVCGNASAKSTAAALFGQVHAVKEIDAPLNRYFMEATRGLLGTVEHILRTRTATGLFWPFLPSTRRESIRMHFRLPERSMWATLMSMTASPMTLRVLRYCPECAAGDMKDIGITRWRLAHQLIGAYVCLDHSTLLRRVLIRRSAWLLPQTTAGDEGPGSVGRIPSASVTALRRLAFLTWACVGVDEIQLETLREVVSTRLREMGVTSWLFPLNASRLANWFAQTGLALALRNLGPSEHKFSQGAWVHELLRRRRGEHPLMWLALWTAIHADDPLDSVEQGFLSPLVRPVVWDEFGQGCLWSNPRFTLPPAVKVTIQEAGTLKQAANTLGITVHALRKQLEKEGCRGGDFFRPDRTRQRHQQALYAIARYIEVHPKCSRTDIHHACKADVSWLGRHAHDDLMRALAVIPERRSQQLELPLGCLEGA